MTRPPGRRYLPTIYPMVETIPWDELREEEKVAVFAALMKKVIANEMSANEMYEQQLLFVSLGVPKVPEV